MRNDHREKMNQQLDAQIQELEQRFNQFLKELEEDFDFVPSAIKKNAYEEDHFPEIDHRLADIEKRYASVDRKYNIVLGLTALVMLSVLGYLGYVILG
jgi:DNA repair exonuclease SbcCD ATPase subunit